MSSSDLVENNDCECKNDNEDEIEDEEVQDICIDNYIDDSECKSTSTNCEESSGISVMCDDASQCIDNISNVNGINSINDCNNNFSFLINETHPGENKYQSVTLAALFNYEDDKPDNNFPEKTMTEIYINYEVLKKVFFNDAGKSFSTNILNKIWSGIKNFSLASCAFDAYEEKTGKHRDTISPIKKVQLYKECAIASITSVIRKIYALNLYEYNNACGSVDIRDDGVICTNIVLHLFFNSLELGIKINLRFAVSNIPRKLIGKMQPIYETTHFDFSEVNCIKKPQIIYVEGKEGNC